MEEKRRLTDGVHRLQPHQLMKVVSFVRDNAPASAGRGENETELNIDALDSHTLRQLQAYVSECLGPYFASQAAAATVAASLDAVPSRPGSGEALNSGASIGAWLVEGGWKLLRVVAQLELGLIGEIASVLAPLKAAGISVFVQSTYDTDYLMVKSDSLDKAIDAMRRAGHDVRP